jgi:aspartate/methionine/tyrosine aminotransferase
MTLERTPPPARFDALREVPYMGVIWVVAEAHKLGFVNGHPDWCNLGQGQPEVGPMEGAPPRVLSVEMQAADCAYGPLEGLPELRALVADTYNRLYRRGKRSQYGPENVAIASGGRLALTRAMAALGSIQVGYQIPDYTAYEDMLNLHLDRLTPVAIRGRREDGFAVTTERLRAEVAEKDLGTYVLSNPCNPTGNVVQGAELASLVALARESGMHLFADEFYSHFVYEPVAPGRSRAADGPVSAAAHVEDVERDPVLVFDGLTKSHRYPGWRLGWVLGPSHLVETMARTASSIDGGPSRIAQRAALAALAPEQADRETSALRVAFAKKRDLMVQRLSEMGVVFAREPRGTFYCWGSLESLPPPFDDGLGFFRRALERKVMTVPGEFFDVNPGKRRRSPSPYRQWMRFSFGPPMENVAMGLDRLGEMLASAP